MKLFQFLKSKTFFLNIAIIVLLFIGLGYGVLLWTASFTHHGEEFEMPELKGYDIQEVESTLNPLGLRFEVLDSSEYYPELPPMSVISHYPHAGFKVKQGRRINITLNPSGPRLVKIPDIIEKSRRRAVYDLESKGFKVGKFSYVPYIGKDMVVGIQVKEREVNPGDEFPKGTLVNLILGMGLSSEFVETPYMIGLGYKEALEKIKANFLNVGEVFFDETAKDTLLMFVYKQDPYWGSSEQMQMGAEMSLWFTQDINKMPLDTLDTPEIPELD